MDHSSDSLDLKIAKSFLDGCGLKASRYPKGKGINELTPDFKVFSGTNHVFNCEVKSLSEDDRFDVLLDAAPPGEIVGGVFSETIFNRISSHVHKAAKQLCAVNPKRDIPNVLAIINHDKNATHLDFHGAATGNAILDSGVELPIYEYYSKGRIKNDLPHLHLILWLDDLTSDWLFFIECDPAHDKLLRSLLSNLPKRPKPLDVNSL